MRLVYLVRADEVFRNQDQGTPASGRTVSAADVVLYGVNIVLPLMSQDLLKVKPVLTCGCVLSVSLRVLLLWANTLLSGAPPPPPVPLSVQPVLQAHHLHL